MYVLSEIKCHKVSEILNLCFIELARNSQDRAAIEQMVIHSIESTETTESRQPLPAASPLPNSDRDVTVQQQSAGATASMSSLALQPSLQLPPPQSQ